MDTTEDFFLQALGKQQLEGIWASTWGMDEVVQFSFPLNQAVPLAQQGPAGAGRRVLLLSPQTSPLLMVLVHRPNDWVRLVENHIGKPYCPRQGI